jgi:hypothetical protein
MKQQIKKTIPSSIKINVYHYKDDEGNVHFDFEEMANEFEEKLSELDSSVVVMCSVESNED